MTTKTMANEFESSIEYDFGFLKTEYGFDFNGVRSVDDDPRDAYLLARFSKGDARIDVAWNEMAKSLSILIRLCKDELGRKERYVYFEPFVEFLSKGQVLPIAPQLFPRMTMKSIDSVMRQRSDTFKVGIASKMALLAEKLREYLEPMQSSSVEMIREYHKWYEGRTA
jgi:hypothetical protein